MTATRRLLCLCTLLLLGLPACSSETLDGRAELPAPGPALNQAVLPGLATLGAPQHAAAMLGPGFVSLPPQQYITASNCTAGAGATLDFSAAAAMAYAVYGVAGFDGDNGPTSAVIDVSGLSGAQYSVAFSDYFGGVWRFAGPFNASAEVEIPLPGGEVADAYCSPQAFVSHHGIAYLAILLPEGGSMTLDELQLGVHGGMLGPRPTGLLSGSGGDNGFLLTWFHSPDYLDPDFAGYALERAPLLGGDYYPCNGALLEDNQFLDTDAQLDVEYRYRVAAVDCEAHYSVFVTGAGGPKTGEMAKPLALLDLPRGPLYGPVEVTLDLSGSSDPEGVGITTFSFNFVRAPDSVSGASPTLTFTLQPGCHIIEGVVETGDGRIGQTRAQLKVYPQWQPAPVLVHEPDGTPGLMRASHPQMAIDPVRGRMLLFGHDETSGSYMFWRDGGGGVLDPASLPLYGYFGETCEPAKITDELYFPVATNSQFMLAHYSAGAIEWLAPGIAVEWNRYCAAASDAFDRLWLIVSQNSVPPIDLVAFDSYNFGTPEIVVADIGTLLAVDAEYAEATGQIHIVYANGVTTEYVCWDPSTHAITDAATLSPMNAMYIDVELNPLSGLPAVLYHHTGRVRYREQDDMACWSVEELPDDTGPNGTKFDFAFGVSGNAFAYFPLAGSGSHLYERTAPDNWAIRNTPPLAATSGHYVGLTHFLDSDDFIAVDFDNDGHGTLLNLAADGSCEVIAELPQGQGYGAMLGAAAGTSDSTDSGDEVLHVMFQKQTTVTAMHLTSEDGGASWDLQAEQPYPNFDLAATGEGSVYAAESSLALHELHLWDPATLSWLDEALTVASNSAIDRSFLDTTAAGEDLLWVAYNGTTGNVHWMTGTFGAFVPHTYASPCGEIIAGTSAPLGTGHTLMVLAGGTTEDEPNLYYSLISSDTANIVANSALAEAFYLFSAMPVRQRLLASATAACDLGQQLEYVCWSAQGQTFYPLRYWADAYSGLNQAELGMLCEPWQTDLHRTASAITASGATAVALLASCDGKDAYMEWSNYGEWERLDLPEALQYACGPELLFGRDGRWHILYKDWRTDSVMCLSTQP